MPEWAMTKLVSSSLIGMWLLTGSPSFCAAHCSQRCFSIFLPPLISVRCTVADLLQLSHFMGELPSCAYVESYFARPAASTKTAVFTVGRPPSSYRFPTPPLSATLRPPA